MRKFELGKAKAKNRRLYINITVNMLLLGSSRSFDLLGLHPSAGRRIPQSADGGDPFFAIVSRAEFLDVSWATDLVDVRSC